LVVVVYFGSEPHTWTLRDLGGEPGELKREDLGEGDGVTEETCSGRIGIDGCGSSVSACDHPTRYVVQTSVMLWALMERPPSLSRPSLLLSDISVLLFL